jgi:cation diffusion facilitator family transporter
LGQLAEAQKLLNPKPIEALGWGVGLMLFSAVVNTIVSKMLFKVGRETDSIALQADAWHLRTDVYTSAGVMGSLSLMWLAQWAFPGRDFNWLDPLAAIGTAVLILKAAYDLTVQSAKDLLDVHLPKVEEDLIRQCILENQPMIHGAHDLRTRKAGNFRFVEFHMQVDSNMTVIDSHAIAETLSTKIKQQLRSATVTIHIEPCDKSCPDKCVAGCLILEQKR